MEQPIRPPRAGEPLVTISVDERGAFGVHRHPALTLEEAKDMLVMVLEKTRDQVILEKLRAGESRIELAPAMPGLRAVDP